MQLRTSEDNGFAFVAVLVFLLLLSGFVATLSVYSHVQLKIASNSVGKLKMELLAEASVFLFIKNLNVETTSTYFSDGFGHYKCDYGDEEIQISVQDHIGLIDLNMASSDQLVIGFTSLGFDEQTAIQLSNSIVNFRSLPTQKKLETAYVPESGDKAGFFDSVSELHDFSALRDFSVIDLESVFSVHKKSRTVDFRKSPASLKKAAADFLTRENALGVTPSGFITVDVFAGNTSSDWGAHRYYFQYSDLNRAAASFLGRASINRQLSYWSEASSQLSSKFCLEMLGEDL